jgi:imidazolonepropionase-like amidohydrolase
MMFAIVNAVVDPVTGKRIDGGTVLVRDGRVAGVGAKVKVPKSAEVFDAGGKLVTPGFMDAHCHAGLVEDGIPHDRDINEKTDPVTPQLRAIDAFRPTDPSLHEAAESGVTSVYITPGSANVIGGLGAVVKTLAPDLDAQIVRLDAGMKMATGENPKRVYGELNRMPSTRMGTAAVLRAALTDTKIYLEKKARHARRRSGPKDPFEVDLGKEAIAGILDGRYPARCHAHRSIDMLTAIRIAEEFDFPLVFEHATECEDILDQLARRRIPIVLGPSFGMRTKTETLRKGFHTAAPAVAAGLTVAITADTNVTPLRYLNVYAALAIREGLAPQDALRAVTINPARICAVDERLGSIERGKDADLVCWDGDPFDARTRPAAVWISGERVGA